MKSHNKIVLDRVVGRSLAFILNLTAMLLGRVMHRDHDDSPEKVKTIVIAKLLGMGSILRSTPMVKALKQKYPAAHYIFITTLKNKPLVERLELFDGYLYIRDTSFFTIFIDTLSLIFKLWAERIDLYFDLEIYSAFSAILALLSLARNRYGFYKDTTLFRMGVHTHLAYFNSSQHISKVYLRLARSCEIKNLYYKIEKINPREEDKQELKSWLLSKSLLPDTPYIVINPNASDLLLERRWPMDYFVLLINALAVNCNHLMYIVGSREEHHYVSTLYDKLSEQARKITFNTAGDISLGAVIALINSAQLMITNDSGLYHVAVSLDTPRISLWGPVSPAHYADTDDNKSKVFYNKEIYCSPCLHKIDLPPCRGNNVCMKSISPKEVYEKSCEILGINPSSTDIVNMDLFYKKEYSGDFDITVRIKTPKTLSR